VYHYEDKDYDFFNRDDQINLLTFLRIS